MFLNDCFIRFCRQCNVVTSRMYIVNNGLSNVDVYQYRTDDYTCDYRTQSVTIDFYREEKLHQRKQIILLSSSVYDVSFYLLIGIFL